MLKIKPIFKQKTPPLRPAVGSVPQLAQEAGEILGYDLFDLTEMGPEDQTCFECSEVETEKVW